MKGIYPLTIFLSAFLLFEVELIAGKELLPWFGGHAALWGTGGLFVAALARDRGSFLRRRPFLAGSTFALLLAGLGVVLIRQGLGAGEGEILVVRNFYRILRVVDEGDGEYRKLIHGRITHGFQFLDSARAGIPTSYYSRESGMGLAIDSFPDRDRLLRMPRD
jgi:hypothetical protein